ncbi:50S ribosomal protein L23 [Candidatus Falkowbacteria bacterium]|nr:MAG: 50S ribosomal protein L23 [Candidatus Falkowbacteria bacterium]
MKELYGGGQAETGAKKDDKKSDKTPKGKPERIFGDAYRVIIRPLVTEKAANLGSENKYVFAVNIKANKIEIAKAINEIYGIKPVGINIISIKGKKVRYGRTIGQRKNWKKAIVTLAAGKTIKVYEGV